jgi:hypothetical protein
MSTQIQSSVRHEGGLPRACSLMTRWGVSPRRPSFIAVRSGTRLPWLPSYRRQVRRPLHIEAPLGLRTAATVARRRRTPSGGSERICANRMETSCFEYSQRG